MEYCPKCGVRDPAHYDIQALGETTKARKPSKLPPLLAFDVIAVLAVMYASYGTVVKTPASSDAVTPKPNDDEKAELIKRMRDAVMARHHGVMPETSSEADTKVVLEVSKKWLAEKNKHKLDAMKVKPPPSGGAAEIYLAKDGITKLMREPDSAVFDNVFFVNDRKSETGYYVPVVCGTVNGRNGFGGMTGPKYFVALMSDVAQGFWLEGTTPQNTLAAEWNRLPDHTANPKSRQSFRLIPSAATARLHAQAVISHTKQIGAMRL